MTRTPPLFRLLWAVLALAQISATVIAPVVDALLEGESVGITHVESESSSDCPTTHDHLFCQVCRVISVAGQRTATPCVDALGAPGRVRVARGAPVVSSPGMEHFGSLGSRAPPRG